MNLSIQFLNSLLIMKHCSCTTVLKYIIQGLIFLGCSTFVALRGYKCFMKYLDAPQSNSISYKFNSRVAFPSISFCPPEWIKNEELQNCHLSTDEYKKGKGAFTNYDCTFCHFLTTYVPSLHFLCSKLHVFLTTYPPLMQT